MHFEAMEQPANCYVLALRRDGSGRAPHLVSARWRLALLPLLPLDRGLTIAQAPSDMDFGRTFVALDPDGHRLRVYWLSDEAGAQP